MGETALGVMGIIILIAVLLVWVARSPKQRSWEDLTREERKRLLPSIPYDREDIFDRDLWICYLCGYPVDPWAEYRDPWTGRVSPDYASIDHVIPLADPNSPGDVPNNVRLAHLGCNMSKGSKPLR